MAISELLKDIQEAMLEGLNDSSSRSWDIESDKIVVTTTTSRDPRRSRNGGEYYYYRVYALVDGGIKAYDDWSCEIALRSAHGGREDFYPMALSTLEHIGGLAEARALAIWKGQAVPVCPICGQGLEEVFAQLENDPQLRQTVIDFLKRKKGYCDLRDAVNAGPSRGLVPQALREHPRNNELLGELLERLGIEADWMEGAVNAVLLSAEAYKTDEFERVLDEITPPDGHIWRTPFGRSNSERERGIPDSGRWMFWFAQEE